MGDASADRRDRPLGLFAYGTLVFDEVMLTVAGEAGPSVDAVLAGFDRRCLRGVVYPGVAPRPGASVSGRLWTEVSPAALDRLDRFEGPMYRRETHVVETPGGPREAAVYVLRPGSRWMMTSRPWEPEAFRRRSLARYTRGIDRG